VLPTHTPPVLGGVTVIGNGSGFTGTAADTVHVVEASVNTTVTVPVETPVNAPTFGPPGPGTIVATVPGAADHVPPPEASDKVIAEPTHAEPGAGTVMLAGNAFTVTVAFATQVVVELVYVMTVVTPVGPAADTTPPGEVTVAVVVVALAHVPPTGAPVKVVVPDPPHILRLPEITGEAFTVTTAVIVHWLASANSVYVTVVVPATVPIPVTIPVADPTLAKAFVPLQVPGVVASVSVVEAPVHTFRTPPMAAGSAFTVIVCVAVHPVAETVKVISVVFAGVAATP
jgi:hypothetical protein